MAVVYDGTFNPYELTYVPIVLDRLKTYFLLMPDVPQSADNYKQYCNWIQFVIGFPLAGDGSQIGFGRVWYPASELLFDTRYGAVTQTFALYWYQRDIYFQIHAI